MSQSLGNVLLPVKYRSQLDNSAVRHGAGNRQCNLTSTVMMADYVLSGGISKRAAALGDREPETLYGRLLKLNHGADTIDHDGHTRCLQAEFGITSYWSQTLRAEDLRSQLDKGIPVVVGVAFKGSGHIVCVIGYDGPTWVVHDPYGTRHGASDRYDVGVGGEADRYSQALMDKIYWDGGKKSGWGRIVTAIASTPTGMPTGI